MTLSRHDLMRTLTLLRIAAIAAVTFSSIVSAQSRPASHPQAPSTNTSLPPTTITAAPPAPVTPAQAPPRRAQISYINGDLAIAAYNSSLNQILREVSRLTGVKISGGVTEERVFGNYGPAATSEVLRTLLDGTGSNILFVHTTGDKPSELILTPRMGGPTLPNPHAVAFDDNSDDAPPPPSNPPISQPSESQSMPSSQNFIPQPITPPPADNNSGATSPPSPTPNSSQQQSPNGVRTPQQIYEELQRLRQQQQQQSKPQ